MREWFLKKSFAAFLERSLWRFKISDWILMFMIAFYSIIFSYYTVMRHYSFRSYAWDLGLIAQSVASVVRGKLFTNNVELFFSPTGSYFGVHFAPVLFLVVPFFYLAQYVETLLVLQSVVLALGAIPVYLIVIYVLDDRVLALFLAASYMLNPLLQGVNWYDFHTQSFFPLFMLLTAYFLLRGNLLPYILFLLMSLSTIEQSAYFILAYVPFSLLEKRRRVFKSYGGRFNFKVILRRFLEPIIMFVVSAAWIALSSTIKNIINPSPPLEIKAVSQFRLLGIKDPSEILIKAILSPSLALMALQYEFPKKIFYIILTLAPSCFLALLSPLALLPVFLWFFIAVLSNWTPYYSPGFQYSSFTIPFIYIALIDALKGIFSGLNGEIRRALARRVSALILLVGIILSMFLSPLSPVHKVRNYDYFRDYGVTTPSLVEDQVMRVIMGISGEPFILTTPTLFPHLSLNPNAYTVPPPNYPSPELFKSFVEYLKSNVKFDYVLITSFWDRDGANLIYTEFIKPSRDYRLMVRGPGLELYKRGYNGPPENITLKFTFRELYASEVTVVDDPTSEAGKVMVFKVSSTPARVIWYGPYIALSPGKYTVRFRIRVEQILDGRLIDLEVYSRHVGRIGLYSVYGEEMGGSSAWQTFSITFSLKDRVSDVEFRGLSSGNAVTVYLDYIEVIPE